MMKFLALATLARNLFGSHKTTLGFFALLHVGVVFFPSSSVSESCVVP